MLCLRPHCFHLELYDAYYAECYLFETLSFDIVYNTYPEYILFPADFATSLTVCALTGKQIMATTLAVTYVYAAELFPTNVRCSGIGMVCVPSALGSLLSRLCYANMVSTSMVCVPSALGSLLSRLCYANMVSSDSSMQ